MRDGLLINVVIYSYSISIGFSYNAMGCIMQWDTLMGERVREMRWKSWLCL